jgi:hypothetical protein
LIHFGDGEKLPERDTKGHPLEDLVTRQSCSLSWRAHSLATEAKTTISLLDQIAEFRTKNSFRFQQETDADIFRRISL